MRALRLLCNRGSACRHLSRAVAFTLLAFAFSSGVSSAAEVWFANYVKHVYPHASGSFVIIFVADAPTCSSASNPDYFNVSVGNNGVTADGAKAMLAVVLTAFVANKRIQLAFDDSTPSCYVNRLLILD